MIKNPAPLAMIIGNVVIGYSKVMMYHSATSDPDASMKVFWYNDKRVKDPSITNTYSYITELEQNTKYRITGAYIDSMVDDELLDAKFNINQSVPIDVTTKVAPKILSYRTEYSSGGVGVGVPYLYLTLDGYANIVEVEISKDGSNWENIYKGSAVGEVSIPNVPEGTFKARTRGTINFPDGVTTDLSKWLLHDQDIILDFVAKPPTKPTNLTFVAAKINDTFERYDVKLSWEWEKGTGSDAREFIVSYTTATDFATNKWKNAQVFNTGSSKEFILTNFPRDIKFKFKVSATAWAADSVNSDIVDFTLNNSTTIDNEFVNQTGIDITYSHILARVKKDGKWAQTFLVDAKTGNVSIGGLDKDGKAPITVDAANNIVNVDGKIITKDINAANVVLTDYGDDRNPSIYTEGKTFESPNSGVWLGVDKKDRKPKLDIGNSKSYVRFNGEKVMISGGVTINTPNGEVPLEEGIQGNFIVFIYKSAENDPIQPSSQEYPPEGWSTTPTLIDNPFKESIYVCQGQLDPVTGKLVSGSNYSKPVLWTGKPGIPINNNIVTGTASFKLEAESPNEVTRASNILPDTGGLNLKDWNMYRGKQVTLSCLVESTGLTEDRARAGCEIAVTYSDKSMQYIGAWHTGDTEINSRVRTTNTFKDLEITKIQIGIYVQGKTQYSKVSRVKLEEGEFMTAWVDAGVDGIQGTNGPGFYSQPITGSTWSDEQAIKFFQDNMGRAPSKYDVLTQYQTTNPTNATTKQFNGKVWETPVLAIHGNMVLDGTLSAKKLVADEAFLANLGVNIIYNRDAALSDNPEEIYKMKIDLLNGSIHIR